MTNPSDPYIQPPVVPNDFEALAGNTKTDFARALMSLLSGAQIKNITSNQPSEFDFGTLQQKVTDLETLFTRAVRKVRNVTVAGAADNTEIPISFEDIGTIDYSVAVMVIVPQATNPGPVATAYLVSGSKLSDGCILQCEGSSSGLQLEITIVAEVQ